MKNYDHAIKMLSAGDGNVEVKYSGCERWEPPMSTLGAYHVATLNNPDRLRIKPANRKVPLGAEDIKPGMWFRLRSWAHPCRRLVDAVYDHGIHLGDDINSVITWSVLQRDYSCSIDGITWSQCEKDEVVK